MATSNSGHALPVHDGVVRKISVGADIWRKSLRSAWFLTLVKDKADGSLSHSLELP